MKQEWSRWRKANFNYFQKHLVIESKDKFLIDLGAGEVQFKEITNQFRNVKVDFYSYPDIDVTADLTKDFPFSNNYCDIVFVSNTLEHIPNTQHFLNECYRILKPGGGL